MFAPLQFGQLSEIRFGEPARETQVKLLKSRAFADLGALFACRNAALLPIAPLVFKKEINSFNDVKLSFLDALKGSF